MELHELVLEMKQTDFSRWKGIYETWQRRKATYSAQIHQRDPADALRVQPVY